MERVVQHVGDLAALLAEAKRITRPGGRIVIADTDWGSLMIHPGDRDLIRRFKAALETGPMAEPWAGRTLHDAMLASDLTDVTSRMYPITAGLNAGRPPLAPMFDQFVEARLATRSETDDLMADLAAAFERGGPSSRSPCSSRPAASPNAAGGKGTPLSLPFRGLVGGCGC